MGSILENIRLLLPVLIIPWAVFIISTIWKPQRFRNSLYLMICLVISLFFISSLFGDYMEYALLGVFLICMFGLFLVPILLVTNGIIMMKKESRSLANILSLLLGIVVAVGEIATVIIVFRTGDFSSMHTYRLLWVTFLTVFYFSYLILAFVVYSLFIQWLPYGKKFDYIIIHGSGLIKGRKIPRLLQNRIEKAIWLYHLCGDNPYIIPSGGKGNDEALSEAAAMKEYLLKHGIPEDKIILEDRSVSTMENLMFSREIIDSRGGSKHTALVTSNYHVYRCLCYAKRLKFSCKGIGAPVAWYFWPSALIREFVAIFSQRKYLIGILLGWLCLVLPLVIFSF